LLQPVHEQGVVLTVSKWMKWSESHCINLRDPSLSCSSNLYTALHRQTISMYTSLLIGPAKSAIKNGNLDRQAMKSSLLIFSSSSMSNVLNSSSICNRTTWPEDEEDSDGRSTTELCCSRGSGNLPRHPTASSCLTAGYRPVAPGRSQMFQHPCTSRRQFHRYTGTAAAS
jgi:hypothetical protein